MNNKFKIAVVGAGASGMVAALTAAGYGAEVTLFEKKDRVGKKILSTGNGKCNLGNLNFSTEQYYCRDKKKLHKMFCVFSVWDSLSFFESIGLMVKNKNDYLYPRSEQASAVLDVLRTELVRRKVHIATETEIVKAVYHKNGKCFELTDFFGKTSCFQKLIIACGSPASLKRGDGLGGYNLAKGFGHKIRQIMPGLVQLRSDECFLKALSGVRVQAGIRLLVNEKEEGCEMGELQFTDYGISGIPVFQFSRIAAYALNEKKNVKVIIDFFPEQEEKCFTVMCRLRYESQMDKSIEEYLTGTSNKKINMVMAKQAGLKPGTKVEEAGWPVIWKLMRQYRAFAMHISGVNPMENAQVCAGGVDFGQVSADLESEIVKGLYFAGEVLDIDGKCGGYNLQWAWTSGYIAGRNAAEGPTGKNPENEKKQEILSKDKERC